VTGTAFDEVDRAFFMPTTVAPPAVALDEAERVAREHVGVEARAERLTGERDENFRLRTGRGLDFVLKIAGPGEAPITSDLSVAVLLHLERFHPGLPVPRIHNSLSHETQIQFTDGSGAGRRAMLYTFLPGRPLMTASRSAPQRISCARLSAQLARALRSFRHPAMHRPLVWDLRQLPRLAKVISDVAELPHRAFLAQFVAQFTALIAPRLDAVRRQFVHNDFNARNIIVDDSEESRVVGIIDFGDALHTALIADVAVGVIGQLATADTADDAIREFIAAYCEVEPLVPEELALLDWLVAARIVQNVVMTSWYRSCNPDEAHFSAFDAAFFEWRVELAKRLASAPPA
jgi:hydroxylysine kinase